jgi:hypothetical protein
MFLANRLEHFNRNDLVELPVLMAIIAKLDIGAIRQAKCQKAMMRKRMLLSRKR